MQSFSCWVPSAQARPRLPGRTCGFPRQLITTVPAGSWLAVRAGDTRAADAAALTPTPRPRARAGTHSVAILADRRPRFMVLPRWRAGVNPYDAGRGREVAGAARGSPASAWAWASFPAPFRARSWLRKLQDRETVR